MMEGKIYFSEQAPDNLEALPFFDHLLAFPFFILWDPAICLRQRFCSILCQCSRFTIDKSEKVVGN